MDGLQRKEQEEDRVEGKFAENEGVSPKDLKIPRVGRGRGGGGKAQ